MNTRMVVATWTIRLGVAPHPSVWTFVGCESDKSSYIWALRLIHICKFLKMILLTPLANILVHLQHHRKDKTRIWAWERHHPTRTDNKVSCNTGSPSSFWIVLDFGKPLWLWAQILFAWLFLLFWDIHSMHAQSFAHTHWMARRQAGLSWLSKDKG